MMKNLIIISILFSLFSCKSNSEFSVKSLREVADFPVGSSIHFDDLKRPEGFKLTKVSL